MNRLEKILAKWNFKKIVIWYLIAAVVAGLACAATVGILYRERLNFAWQYSRLAEAKTDAALQTAADKTAAASSDVVDVLVLDEQEQVTYSARQSQFSVGLPALSRVGDEKKYLASPYYPDAVFQYVKRDEFMLNSILNHDFGQVREDYDEESAFEQSLASKTIYLLSRFRAKSGATVYVITVPTSVPGGMLALKVTAALAMLFFCLYWVLLALWMFRDAANAKLSPLYWGLIGLFTNIIGLIVYKIYKRSSAVCPSCGAAQSTSHLYCSFCGTALGARCSACGSKVGAKDRFCHHCGKEL